MKFGSTLLLTFLGVTLWSLVSAAKDGVRGSGTNLLADDVIDAFKSEHGLKPEYSLFLQTIDPYASFEYDGSEYSLALEDLAPFSVDAEGMAILVDDEEVNLSVDLLYLGQGSSSEQSFLVEVEGDGKVSDIEFTNIDDSVTLITEVFDSGIYATIPADAYDPTSPKNKLTFGNDSGVDVEENEAMDEDDPLDRRLFQVVSDETSSPNGRYLQGGCPAYRNIEVAIAFDSSFCSWKGGATEAIKEVKRIVAHASNSWYRRPSLCVNIAISHIEGYCKQNDPYNWPSIDSCLGSNGMLREFSSYWKSNRGDVSRDAAHLFRHRKTFTDAVACAYTSSICSRSWGYAVIDFTGLSSSVVRAVTFAHELGHNLGADHVPNNPNKKYIMEPRVNDGTHGFSQVSKASMREHIEASNCAETIGPGSVSFLHGAYTIQQKVNYRYLDAYEGSENDFNAITRTKQDNDSQLWFFVPQGYIFRVQQKRNNMYLDAYTGGRYSAVTRARQDNPSQEWAFYWQDKCSWNPDYVIQQLQTRRYLDAHLNLGNDYDAVTREWQGDDTQKWKITPLNSRTYRIQQKKNGRYLDAYTTSGEDYSVVTRSRQNDDTQEWTLTNVGVVYTIQHQVNNRYLDAYTDSGNGFSVVTRRNRRFRRIEASQLWVAKNTGGDTYTLQQLENLGYLDAFENGLNDSDVVTRTAQDNDSQKWIIRKKLGA